MQKEDHPCNSFAFPAGRGGTGAFVRGVVALAFRTESVVDGTFRICASVVGIEWGPVEAGILSRLACGVALHAGCYYWVYHTMISMSSLPRVWLRCALCCFAYSGLQLGFFGMWVPWIRKWGELRRSG